MDETFIRELERTGYGWMTPKGRFVNSDAYRHLETLRNYADELPPQLNAWISTIEALDKRVNEKSDEFAESVKHDDHPGWHRFNPEEENEAANLRKGLMTWIYRQGWIRLGIQRNIIEAEGCPTPLREKKKVLEDLALMIGKDLLLTPTSWRMETMKTKISAKEIQNGLPEFYSMAVQNLQSSKAWKGGLREKHLTFTLLWQMSLDSFSPENMSIHIPKLFKIIAPFAHGSGHFQYYAYETENGQDWKWKGDFPTKLLQDIESVSFTPIPEEDGLKAILEKYNLQPVESNIAMRS